MFNRGSGTIVQGIFISDEVGTLPYQRVTVTDNVIVGAMYNGIAVAGANDAKLTNNTVIGDGGPGELIGAWNNVEAATLAGNVATGWSFNNSDGQRVGRHPDHLADAGRRCGPLRRARHSGCHARPAVRHRLAVLGDGPGQTSIGWATSTGPRPAGGTARSTSSRSTAPPAPTRFGARRSAPITSGLCRQRQRSAAARRRRTSSKAAGNDIYTIYNAADVVVEKAGEGTDTVNSYINYTLGANVENVRARRRASRSTAMRGDNTLTGASRGQRTSTARAGNDTVQGAAGNDTLEAATATTGCSATTATTRSTAAPATTPLRRQWRRQLSAATATTASKAAPARMC